MRERALVGWSGGKDSAVALYELKQMTNIDVDDLLTIATDGYDRISMHGIRHKLLVAHAKSLGSPLDEVLIPQTCTNEICEQRMRDALEK
jgi:diphthamide synthase (EF-2-diphthine--ammonia ligase)